MGSLYQVTTGLLRGPISTPYDRPFVPNWGLQPPVKTCIANCDRTVPDTTVVCIDPKGNIPLPYTQH